MGLLAHVQSQPHIDVVVSRGEAALPRYNSKAAMRTGVMPVPTPDPVTHITMRSNALPMSTSAPAVSLSAVSGRPSHGGNTPGSSTTGKGYTMICDQIPTLEPT